MTNILTMKNTDMNFGFVKQKVSDYTNLLDSITNKTDNYLTPMIDDLQKLYNSLISQEQVVYNKLGINKNEIQYMNEKLQEWNNSGAGEMTSPECLNEVYSLFQSKVDDAQLIQELETLLNAEPSPLFDDKDVKEAILNEEEEVLASTLFNEFIKNSDKEFKVSSFNKGKSKGIDSQITLMKGPKGKIKIKVISESQKLGQSMKVKLAKIVDTINENKPDILKSGMTANIEEESVRKQLVGIIIKYTGSNQYTNYIIEQIYKKFSGYNFNRNYFVIKGFLQEIYANAFFSFLTGRSSNVQATGILLNQYGKQLNADAILYQTAGVQVKKWSIKDIENGNQVKEINSKISLGQFLQSRFQNSSNIWASYAAPIIAWMFGVASYNKPIDEEGMSNLEYKDYYYNVVKPQTERTDDLEQAFYANLSSIIGIDAGQTVKTDGMFKERSFMNTFWLINDKLIPSSIIVQQLLTNIKNEISSNALVSFHLNSLTEKSEGDTWSPQNRGKEVEAYSLAKRWDLNYTITFYFNRLVDQISSQVA